MHETDEPDIRLYVIRTRISCKVYDWEMLAAVGLTKGDNAEPLPSEAAKAKVLQSFPGGEWVEIWLKAATGKQRREINEKCRMPDAEKGFVYDASLQQAARMAVMVKRWNGIEVEPSMSAYDAMHQPLIDAIDTCILAQMYPSAEADPHFFALWKSRQKASGENSPSCSTGRISTKESTSGSASDAAGQAGTPA